MQTARKFGVPASVALTLAALLAYAHANGPDPRHTGAPGDDPLACATSGCHTGTPLNGGGGSVVINLPKGQTYSPGQQQTFTVVVTDPNPRYVYHGFQMTARLSTDPANGQAGDFTPTTGEIVICDDSELKGPSGCPPGATVQFIEHNTPGSGTWNVTWTPPSADVGDVYFFVAGQVNQVNTVPDGGHVYTAHYTLSPAAGSGSKPTVAAVNPAAGFNSKANIASGTWLEIYGSNFTPAARGWTSTDFQGSNAPVTLNGVSVRINGNPAFVDYVSSGQVNVQAPDDAATGSVQLVVANPDGQSDPITIQKAALGPALLAPSAWNVGGKQYVVAQYTTDLATYAGPANLIGGLPFRPAKAGDLITIYGIGFGPVTPAVPSGTVAPQTSALQTAPAFLFGQTPGVLTCSGCYYGLAPFAVGLYQFNIQVPSAGTGDVPLTVTAGGVSANQQLYITLQ